MVLAAGLGTRLRPLTNAVPKPLIEIGGRTILDHAIDRLTAAGVEEIVVNLHHKAAMIRARLATRTAPRVHLSEESELLDTGGGVRQALPLLGDEFFVVNGDVFWLDRKEPALDRLARVFERERADAVLLLQRTVTAIGYDGTGDFFLDPLGVPRRRQEREIAPYVFAGVQLLHRRLFEDVPDRVFSLNRLYDRAAERGRLRAIGHDGEWYHIGTPEGLAATRERLSSHRIER